VTASDLSSSFEQGLIKCRVIKQARIFWGGRGCAPPRNDLHPHSPPEAFGTPANYIYFDLIVSYLILTTKFVKLPILWSQISPCRPKTNFVKLFPWPFRALPPGQSKQQHPPPQIFIHTPPVRKYENPSLLSE
jgi:hypothetical protein